jgi:hypothetical protein
MTTVVFRALSGPVRLNARTLKTYEVASLSLTFSDSVRLNVMRTARLQDALERPIAAIHAVEAELAFSACSRRGLVAKTVATK